MLARMRIWLPLVGMLFSVQLHAAVTRVSCHDPDGIDGSAGEWYALYSIGENGSADAPDKGRHRRAGFHELGFRPYRGWNLFYSAPMDASWQVSVRPLDRAGVDSQRFTTHELLKGSATSAFVEVDLYPQLLTPNGHCTLFLRAYDYLAPSDPKPAGQRVAIVGDSLTQAFTATSQQRRALALEFAQHGWHMEVSAIGGLAWQLAPDAPLGANLLDEIRGLLTTKPDSFVFELGSNDAMHIAIRRVLPPVMTKEQLRHNTVRQIAQTLAEVDAYAPAMCKILITPSTHPYYIVVYYVEEANFVGDVLRFFAGQPTRTDISAYVQGLHPINNARVVDWAAASADKRIAALMPDGIHMKEEAAVEFRALWMQEIAACEKHAAATLHGGAR